MGKGFEMSEELREETEAEQALRSLACWLGVGGYNAPTVDAKLYEQKIKEGITTYLPLHGMAARDLAELVLDMGMVTAKGLRARDLARRVLGLVPPSVVVSGGCAVLPQVVVDPTLPDDVAVVRDSAGKELGRIVNIGPASS